MLEWGHNCRRTETGEESELMNEDKSAKLKLQYFGCHV